MFQQLSLRLLPILQLTRMALVFTAIADSVTGLLLRAARMKSDTGSNLSIWAFVDRGQLIATALISIGLYGYGMSLNDIIDRRRDSQLAPQRPLPSARIGVFTAHLICIMLGLLAIAGGLYFAFTHATSGIVSLGLVIWTILLITFYDSAGKYLVAPGLVSLGLIRFFHCVIPAPELPILWHPLVLFTHVTLLSMIAYHWEQKRPPLTRSHTFAVLFMLLVIDGLALFLGHRMRPMSLPISTAIIPAVVAMVLFLVVGWIIARKNHAKREAGQTLMLYGLLWLIVYDACFVAGFVGWIEALCVFALLPVAYGAVQVMRWWSKVIAAAQRPEYKRAGV